MVSWLWSLGKCLCGYCTLQGGWIGGHRDGSAAPARRHAVHQVGHEQEVVVGIWQSGAQHGQAAVHAHAQEEATLGCAVGRTTHCQGLILYQLPSLPLSLCLGSPLR